jgi:D-alanyl-lipoteichoic acid acyltransferase DltB (MBOAT superfamily)
LDIILPWAFPSTRSKPCLYAGRLSRPSAAARSFLDFATFVAFFPQLVAGPIERASNLLPQIENPRTVTRAGIESGLWLIFWGLFKKCVVADNLAILVDGVFGAETATGAASLLALYAFAFQILCDFSGYSDMARGLARWMGVELMVNFNNPYFAVNPKDFWARWHISLSSWLRDYLYITLGGNRRGRRRTYVNLALTMLLGGLWHGAAWTFVAWGAFHGAMLVVYHAWAEKHVPKGAVDSGRGCGCAASHFSIWSVWAGCSSGQIPWGRWGRCWATSSRISHGTPPPATCWPRSSCCACRCGSCRSCR